jgi:hypothetical protein
LLDDGFTFAEKKATPSNVDLEALHRQHQQQGASGIPASTMGSDEDLRDSQTVEEKMKRLNDLTDQCEDMQANGQSIKNTPQYKEIQKLRVELGYQ